MVLQPSNTVLWVSAAAAACFVAGSAWAEGPDAAARNAYEQGAATARAQIGQMAASGMSAEEQARTSPRIVNGVPETAGSAWRWAASVYLTKPSGGISGVCGGSLVKPHIQSGHSGKKYVADWVESTSDLRWVITAAHCVTDKAGVKVKKDKIVVRAGGLNSDDQDRTTQTVEEFQVHPNYNAKTFDNDIALLRLSPPQATVPAGVKRSSIRLPSDLDHSWLYRSYVALTVHGWGRTSEGGYLSTYLQKVRVPVVDEKTCSDAYQGLGYSIAKSMMCAGYRTGGYDSCAGDSGGPIAFVPVGSNVVNPVSTPILAGVVSWGKGCARQNLYGVYANVLKLRPWLEKAAVQLSP